MSAQQSALCMIERTSSLLHEDFQPLTAVLEHALQGSQPGEDLCGALSWFGARCGLVLTALAPTPDPLSYARLAELAAGLPHAIRFDGSALASGPDFAPATGRVVLNLLLLGAEALPQGGTIRLVGSAQEVIVQIAGPNAAWPEGTALCLASEAEAAHALEIWRTPRAAIAATMAKEAGLRLSMIIPPPMSAQPPLLRLAAA